MKRSDGGFTRTEMGGRELSDGRASRRIIFVSDSGALFQGLAQATRASLPGYDTKIVDDLPQADEDAALILFQATMIANLIPALRVCRSRYPQTPIGLILNSPAETLPGLDQIVEDGLAHGIVLLNLGLSAWVSVLQLLISGGEYIAPGLIRRQFMLRHSEPRHAPLYAAPMTFTQEEEASELTPREREVLNFLSEGHQNKIIAARLALSEHTVKVHVHNIMRKLKVHNRTQAAASFRLEGTRYRPPLTAVGRPRTAVNFAEQE